MALLPVIKALSEGNHEGSQSYLNLDGSPTLITSFGTTGSPRRSPTLIWMALLLTFTAHVYAPLSSQSYLNLDGSPTVDDRTANLQSLPSQSYLNLDGSPTYRGSMLL